MKDHDIEMAEDIAVDPIGDIPEDLVPYVDMWMDGYHEKYGGYIE